MFALQVRAKCRGNIDTREQNTFFSKLMTLLRAGNNPGIVLANLCLGIPGQCQLAQPKSVRNYSGNLARWADRFQPLCGDLALFNLPIQWICELDWVSECGDFLLSATGFVSFTTLADISPCPGSAQVLQNHLQVLAMPSWPLQKINPVLTRTRTLPQNGITWKLLLLAQTTLNWPSCLKLPLLGMFLRHHLCPFLFYDRRTSFYD